MLFVVSVLIFLMLHLIGGDPARLILGDKATLSAIKALHEKLGLDRSLPVQYWLYIKGIFHFDLGTSFGLQLPVSQLIAQRMPVTVKLTLLSTCLAVLISLPLGHFAGTHKDTVWDHTVRSVALLFISMPSFWIGLLLMILFGVLLGWLPAGGWDASSFGSQLRCLILQPY